LRAPVDETDSSPVACPMAVYPEYRSSRSLWRDDFGPMIVKIELVNGLVGVGYTSMGGIASALLVEMNLTRLVLGKDVLQAETVTDMLIRATLHQGRDGFLMHAISALDLAFWDALGKYHEKPVCELLGTSPGASLPCYLTGYDVAKVGKHNFSGIKWPLKFGPSSGAQGFDDNVADIERLRTELGPKPTIMLDCWMGLDVDYACRLIEAIKPCGIKWIEEPLIAGDYSGYARLRKDADPAIGIACGEHETLVRGALPFLSAKLVDYWQSDVTWAGGITQMKHISELALHNNIALVPHYGSTPWAAHFCFSSDACTEIEWYDLTTEYEGNEQIYASDTRLHEGVLFAGELPGFGVTINWDLVHHELDKRVSFTAH